jgi:hypothetical protein
MDAAAHPISPDAATFASLPLPLAQRIFLALPPDARGRASCVCRAWRDALAEPSLWTRLDMSDVRVETHIDRPRLGAVLRGAAVRARGALRQLDLSQHEYVSRDVLLPVLNDNAGSLRELHLHHVVDDGNTSVTVEAVVAAAPLLQLLTADEAYCTCDHAPRMLRAEPPFALLQIRRRLDVDFPREDGGMERFAPIAAALADATLQPALYQLYFWQADTAQPAMMGALADAALARRLRELELEDCTPPAAAPLARLLAGGSLTVLEITQSFGARAPLFDAAGAALVADALRMNAKLTKLDFCRAHLCLDIDAACAFLGALVGHRSLRELRSVLEVIMPEHCIAFGAAQAALIAADAPALRVLDCSMNSLGDAGLAPIVEVLPLNRHLYKLDMGHNGMSEAFARERLLPAVRTNTTLFSLECVNVEADAPAAALEAEELVRRRGQRG